MKTKHLLLAILIAGAAPVLFAPAFYGGTTPNWLSDCLATYYGLYTIAVIATLVSLAVSAYKAENKPTRIHQHIYLYEFRKPLTVSDGGKCVEVYDPLLRQTVDLIFQEPSGKMTSATCKDPEIFYGYYTKRPTWKSLLHYALIQQSNLELFQENELFTLIDTSIGEEGATVISEVNAFAILQIILAAEYNVHATKTPLVIL